MSEMSGVERFRACFGRCAQRRRTLGRGEGRSGALVGDPSVMARVYSTYLTSLGFVGRHAIVCRLCDARSERSRLSGAW